MAGADFPRNRGNGVIIPQNRTLDLSARNGPFHQNLPVVFGGGLEAGLEFSTVAGFGNPHGGTEVRRFDKDGIAEFLFHGEQGLARSRLPFGAADRQIGNDGQAALAEEALHDLLVHAHGGAEHARSHVRDASEFEQSLDGSVLAERAMQDRKDHVERPELAGRMKAPNRNQRTGRRRGRRQDDFLGFPQSSLGAARSTGEFRPDARPPPAFLGDLDGNDLVLFRVSGGDDVPSRLERHLVLRRTAAKENP